MSTLTLQPTVPDNLDNMLSRENPNTNYGTNNTLQAGTDNTLLGDTVTRFLVGFDVSSIQSGSVINSATLTFKLTGAGARPGPTIFTASRVTREWTHSGSTWNKYDGTNNWTTPGGDYTATGAVTASVGAPVAGSTAVWTGLEDLVSDAIENRSGLLSLIITGPEDVGYDAFLVAHSGHSTVTAANRPKLEIDYTTYPIVERIARVIADRLENVTEADDYSITLDVVRPLREGVTNFTHGLCVLEQAAEAARDPDNSFPGNPPSVCWDQDFTITIYVSPEDTSTPLDTVANMAAADAESAITNNGTDDWAQMDGLALLTEQTGRDIYADGETRQVRLTYRVKYRTSENDPYTVR